MIYNSPLTSKNKHKQKQAQANGNIPIIPCYPSLPEQLNSVQILLILKPNEWQELVSVTNLVQEGKHNFHVENITL